MIPVINWPFVSQYCLWGFIQKLGMPSIHLWGLNTPQAKPIGRLSLLQKGHIITGRISHLLFSTHLTRSPETRNMKQRYQLIAKIRVIQMEVFGLQREVKELEMSQGRGVPFLAYVIQTALSCEDMASATTVLVEIQEVLDNFQETISETGLEFNHQLRGVCQHVQVSMHSLWLAYPGTSLLYFTPS
ncbi:hypothetical protein C8J56DRAFT_894338 [Mycena floridula]|nr:hypothetical protein C8J56DRAFT_894338 [Mycena floridula]